MKKLSILAVAVLGVLSFSSVGNAAVTDPCGNQAIAFATWSAWNTSALGCTFNDKAFSNFNITGPAGTVPNDTSVQFSSSGPAITINFQNGGINAFNSNFTLSYTVSVVPGLDPTGAPSILPWRITQVAAGIQTVGNGAVASLTKSCSPVCSPTPSATANGSGTITQVVGNVSQATSVTVTDTYMYSAGIVTNIANSFIETAVPEPSTFLLMGGALVGLGLFRNRRRA
jgi:hypothetical protein